MTRVALETNTSVIAEDFPNSLFANARVTKEFPKIVSAIAIPLVAGRNKFGSAVIGFHQPHHFTQEEIEVCEQAAAQVALAMDKTRSLDSAHRRADELDALRATVADISGELELPLLLKAILERAVTLLNATGGDLGLFDPNRDEINIVASHNLGKDFTGTHMKIGEGVMGLSVEQDQLVVLEDYTKWEGRSPQYMEGDWHAAMAIPLRIGGRIVGVLGVVDSDPVREFSAEDQRLLALFAHQAAIAIENARLYAAEKQRARELGVLYESSASITQSLDVQTVCRNAAKQLCKAVSSTSAFILSCDLEKGTAKVLAEFCSENAVREEIVSDQGRTFNLFEYPRSMTYLRRGVAQVIRLSNPDIDSRVREELENHGVLSCLEVPMIVSGRVLGFADIWDSSSDRPWNEEEIRVCQTIANQAAIAVENARLYSEMIQMAVTDMLTGIYNRRGLFENGQRELNRARRFQRPLTAIMLDIDHFKRVNDTYSHAIGDQVLKALVSICQANLREMDILGRYGGEEFVILLPETSCRDAHSVAERLRRRVAETPIITSPVSVSISVSMGIACIQEDITELAVLLDQADTAMYESKGRGRNRITVLPSAEHNGGSASFDEKQQHEERRPSENAVG